MAVLVSPGVLTREIDLSLYVPALTSTILGLVGTATKGLTDVPQLITDVTQLAKVFGDPDLNHPAILTAQWYLKFGRQLQFVRVANQSVLASAFANLGAAAAGPAIVTGTNTGPFTFAAATAATVLGTEVGPYNITLSIAAVLISSAAGPFLIDGSNDSLTIVVDGTPHVVTLTQGATQTVADVIADINNEIPSIASPSTTFIKLTSPTTGELSTIEVTAGNATTLLGFSIVEIVGVDSTNNSMVIKIDGLGSDQPVTFAEGANSAQDIADQINAQTIGVTADLSAGKVRLTSNTASGTSEIEIKTVANDAYATLGFSVDSFTGSAGTNILKVAVAGVDGGAARTITFSAGSVTANATRDAINAILSSALATVASGAIVITTTGTGTGATVQIAASGSTAQTVLGLNTTLHSGTSAGATSIIVTAATPGSWGNGLTVKVTDSVSLAGAKNLIVMLNGFTVEIFRNLVKSSTATTYWETAINGKSEHITVEDQTGVGSQPANTASAAFGSGDDGLSGIMDADFIGLQGDGYTTGMQMLADPTTLDINLVAAPGQSSMAVHAAMISLVSARGDSMCIVDPPLGLTPTQVVDFKRGMNAYSGSRVALDSNRAALYYPWVKGYDPKNAIVVDLPPCAAAIRSYIYNDTVAQLWFAPMGVNRGLIPEAVGIERTLREGEKDYLYENGINPIMNYHNYGITIMGEKTLQVLPTSLDRVNVRRMLDYLHKVVVTTTFGLIGEPNTPRLWRRLVALLTPTMQFLKDQEGVTAYQIVCDSSTNPQNLVNAHELHAKIGILPTPDAEFIYTDFVLVDSMATFQEYLAPAA